MSMDIWIGFAVAAFIILIIPGPTILLVVSQAITHGRTSVAPLVAGVVCGDFTAMTLSLIGMGAILSASAALFTVLKWIGAVYLFYLGIRLWGSDPATRAAGAPPGAMPRGDLFRSSFVVTALNPKSIAFFVAFLPQFIDPANPSAAQFTVLGATFLSLAAINAALYALFAGHLRDTMRNRNVRRWFNRLGGGALIGAGIFTAAMQRSA